METNRLVLKDLTSAHTAFIYELVNTPDWIRFIGNRNILTQEDALIYIRKILSNTAITYWVVQLKENGTPLGVITFIKRDYLQHPDIGFAFLPQYAGNGYALEAAREVLETEIKKGIHPDILATTLPDNRRSILLLEKLGLKKEKTISVEGEELLLYALHPAVT